MAGAFSSGADCSGRRTGTRDPRLDLVSDAGIVPCRCCRVHASSVACRPQPTTGCLDQQGFDAGSLTSSHAPGRGRRAPRDAGTLPGCTDPSRARSGDAELFGARAGSGEPRLRRRRFRRAASNLGNGISERPGLLHDSRQRRRVGSRATTTSAAAEAAVGVDRRCAICRRSTRAIERFGNSHPLRGATGSGPAWHRRSLTRRSRGGSLLQHR